MKKCSECELQAYMKKCLSNVVLDNSYLTERFRAITFKSPCIADREDVQGCCALDLMSMLLFSRGNVSVLLDGFRASFLEFLGQPDSPDPDEIEPPVKKKKVVLRRSYSR